MKKFNKKVLFVLLACICVLSISMVEKKVVSFETTEVSGNPLTLDVVSSRPSAPNAKDASITIKIKNGSGPFKIIAVSNTTLGTFIKEGGNTIVLDQLYAGFYKLYIIDADKNTTEYQVTID